MRADMNHVLCAMDFAFNSLERVGESSPLSHDDERKLTDLLLRVQQVRINLKQFAESSDNERTGR